MPQAGFMQRNPTRKSTRPSTAIATKPARVEPPLISERGIRRSTQTLRKHTRTRGVLYWPCAHNRHPYGLRVFQGHDYFAPASWRYLEPVAHADQFDAFSFRESLDLGDREDEPAPSLDRQATSAFTSTTKINGNGLSLPSSDRNAHTLSPYPLSLSIVLSRVARKPYPPLLATS